MKKVIDFRSDTVTTPTQEMREAMYTAVVGDDVYGDDPTVLELESYAASLVGKEAALFVPTGTFGNQLALFSHCNRGDEVILGKDCHIVGHEVGASAVIAGVQLRALPTEAGMMNLDQVQEAIREDDIHYPQTSLICLENAHSDASVIPVSYMEQIRNIADEHNIKVHLDGARVFNAAVSLGIDVADLTRHADSVMFCLSKGLCAPVGSILAGSADFIKVARKKRKLLGGGMRQVGILAAAGLVSLRKMTARLAEDHKRANYLAVKLSEIPIISVYADRLAINMVFCEIAGADSEIIVKNLLARNIRVNPPRKGVWRFAIHNDITQENVDEFIDALKEIIFSNIEEIPEFVTEQDSHTWLSAIEELDEKHNGKPVARKMRYRLITNKVSHYEEE